MTGLPEAGVYTVEGQPGPPTLKPSERRLLSHASDRCTETCHKSSLCNERPESFHGATHGTSVMAAVLIVSNAS